MRCSWTASRTKCRTTAPTSRHAVLQGAYVVNNPFMWTADDKFFEAGLATRLGVASPKTVALPNKEYVPGIVLTESLRNLVFPLDWQGIVDYLGGFPIILKDAHGGGWKNVHKVHSLEELWGRYDESGLLTMVRAGVHRMGPRAVFTLHVPGPGGRAGAQIRPGQPPVPARRFPAGPDGAHRRPIH